MILLPFLPVLSGGYGAEEPGLVPSLLVISSDTGCQITLPPWSWNAIIYMQLSSFLCPSCQFTLVALGADELGPMVFLISFL